MSWSDLSTPVIRPTPQESDSDEPNTHAGLYLRHGNTKACVRVEVDDLQSLQLKSRLFRDTLGSSHSSANLDTELAQAYLFMQFIQHLLDQNENGVTITRLLEAFDRSFLSGIDIHSLAAAFDDAPEVRQRLLRTYFLADQRCVSNRALPSSALFKEAAAGYAKIHLIFSGQGSANLSCLKELTSLSDLYEPLVLDLLELTAPALKSLCLADETREFYRERRIDILRWLQEPESAPSQKTLATTAFSLPIIGLSSLMEYCIMCRVLHKTPGELRSDLFACSGHSQGLVVATVVAMSDSWEDFFAYSKVAIECLFWIGFHAHRACPQSSVPPTAVSDSIRHAEGVPSSLLSVRGLQSYEIDSVMAKVNHDLPDNQLLHLALKNSYDNFVIAGPVRSLRGLSLHIRALKADADEDDSRVPFNLRKPKASHQFLPVSAPFHTPYLKVSAKNARARLESCNLPRSALTIPVFHTYDGTDLRANASSNLTGVLVDAISHQFANWPATIRCEEASHVITLGAGGMGDLVTRMKEGAGVRVIRGSELHGGSSMRSGGRSELFSPILPRSTLAPTSWKDQYRPQLRRSKSGRPLIQTRLSKLLGAPPVFVAGMTPTTVHWDFVSTIVNAGYHAELASGGYHDAESMSNALHKLARSLPKGRGITVNLIYSSPKSIAWQVPLLKKLRREGIPVEGLTIGAGVPSAEIAKEYIEGLDLRHISFKPGSHGAIREVLDIADASPSFPVILQWTGGRGGGHHSYEDFHAPILDLYAQIRQRENVYLVAGSGFGDAAGTYPYLTGAWSLSMSRAAMPFDGILLGSRMMVAKEAHTSPEAKSLICKAPGVESAQWHRSYNGPAGGVITVKSEMGQPIHKLATRGVLLWAEMDKIFSLPAAKKEEEIQRNKAYIIGRLNRDFAKPWFGVDAQGNPAELAEMTYANALRRLVQLMYIRHQRRWIDPSYAQFVFDFATRALERLSGSMSDMSSMLWSAPISFLAHFNTVCPEASSQLIYHEDAAYFLNRCKAPGQKPVNFVPVIDIKLEHWMKKDSLWQSEDVDAVYDQDAERVCILQGPVAVQHSTTSELSAKEILDSICTGYTKMLKTNLGSASDDIDSLNDSPNETALEMEDAAATRAVSEQFSTYTKRLSLRESQMQPWAHSFFDDDTILHEREEKPNYIKAIIRLQGYYVSPKDDGKGFTVTTTDEYNQPQEVASISCIGTSNISVRLLYSREASEPVTLHLEFNYEPSRSGPRLEDVTETRESVIQNFYAQVWLGKPEGLIGGKRDHFQGQGFIVNGSILDGLMATIGRSEGNSLHVSSNSDIIPMDFLTLIAWDAIVQPLLISDLKYDLLSLVHQSNDVEYVSGNGPLRVDERLTSNSHIESVSIVDAGKLVRVRASILRVDEIIATVVSSFLFKGKYTDFENTLEDNESPWMMISVQSRQDEILLRAREWLSLEDPHVELIGQDLIFKFRSKANWKNRKTYRGLKVDGEIFAKSSQNDTLKHIGRIHYRAGECHGNIVKDYLEQHGRLMRKRTALESPGWDGQSEHEVKMPAQNEGYSRISKDCNPIHTSPAFAALAGLPGCITHGMYTSAIVRTIVENEVAAGDRSRFKSFSANFVGAVMPKDVLVVRLRHVAMVEGRMLFEVSAVKKETDEEVFRGEAEVNQPPTTYVFTGQGAQKKGMGMEVYESSPVARKVWDDIDRFLLDTYGKLSFYRTLSISSNSLLTSCIGWSILHIVRENPKSVTIHFHGAKGRRVRQNYLELTVEKTLADGTIIIQPAFPDLTERSFSHTFSDPRGVLFLTQFAQPAITIVEKANVEDMRSRGLLQEDATFAGHSLGEYGALSCMTDFLDFRTLMCVVFYRGLTMQVAMDRDEDGMTEFGMVAVNPARVGKGQLHPSIPTVGRY